MNKFDPFAKINIKKVTGDKKLYLPLLLLADEQEDMIGRYIEKGTMYILEHGGLKCECIAVSYTHLDVYKRQMQTAQLRHCKE